MNEPKYKVWWKDSNEPGHHFSSNNYAEAIAEYLKHLGDKNDWAIFGQIQINGNYKLLTASFLK